MDKPTRMIIGGLIGALVLLLFGMLMGTVVGELAFGFHRIGYPETDNTRRAATVFWSATCGLPFFGFVSGATIAWLIGRRWDDDST